MDERGRNGTARNEGLIEMKRRTMVLIVMAATLVASLAIVPAAWAKKGATGANADCARCHKGAAVRSGVPAASFIEGIDYSKCRACHWLSGRTRTGYYTHRHQANTACYGCHPTYGSGPAYYPNVRTAYGYFATTDPTALSAADMHRIHVRGSWAQNGTPAACASCHAPAACDACHAVPATHSAHAYDAKHRVAAYAPVSALVAGGTPEGYADAVTARTKSATCVNAACHRVSADGATISKPTCQSCHPAFAAYTPVARTAAKKPSRTGARRRR